MSSTNDKESDNKEESAENETDEESNNVVIE